MERRGEGGGGSSQDRVRSRKVSVRVRTRPSRVGVRGRGRPRTDEMERGGDLLRGDREPLGEGVGVTLPVELTTWTRICT